MFNKNCDNTIDLLNKICVNLNKNKINTKNILEKQFI